MMKFEHKHSVNIIRARLIKESKILDDDYSKSCHVYEDVYLKILIFIIDLETLCNILLRSWTVFNIQVQGITY